MKRCAWVAAAVLFSLAAEPAGAASLKKADGALNGVYNQLIDQLSGRAEQRLRSAQRAWLAFRDAECSLQALGAEGGSAQSAVVAQCMATLTDQRVKQLRFYLNCGEGDLACPR